MYGPANALGHAKVDRVRVDRSIGSVGLGHTHTEAGIRNGTRSWNEFFGSFASASLKLLERMIGFLEPSGRMLVVDSRAVHELLGVVRPMRGRYGVPVFAGVGGAG
jgi:hypothetical protein